MAKLVRMCAVWGSALLLLLSVAVQASEADRSAAAGMEGHWRLAMSAQAAQARIDQAIEQGTEDMRPLRRRIGRKRLHAKNRLIHRVEIDLDHDSIEVVLEGDRYETPADGRLVTVTLSDGEEVRVAQQVKGDRLIQRFVGKDGVRTDVFSLARDGSQLVMNVVLTSDQLPGPIRYRIPYQRR